MQPIDSRIGSFLSLASIALLCGCSPLLMWGRGNDDFGVAERPGTSVADVPLPIDDEPAKQRTERKDNDVEQIAEKAPKAAASDEKPAKPEKMKSSEFVDQLRGADELTAEEQRTIEKIMEKSPEAARFLASRNSDPTIKNLAQLHGDTMPSQHEAGEGIDLLREGRTLPPPPIHADGSPAAMSNAYPPQARLGAPGPLEEPGEARAMVPVNDYAHQQLPVVEYGQGSNVAEPPAAVYGGRLPPPRQLRPDGEAYRPGSAPPPNHAYNNQAYQALPAYPQAYEANGYPPPNDPRMIINHHVQQAPQVYDEVAPAGYNAAYPDTSLDDYPALTSLPEVEPAAKAPAEPGDWRKQLERVIASLESELIAAQNGPGSAADDSLEEGEPRRLTPLQKQDIAQLDAQLRMLYLAGGMRDAAVTPVEYYDADQQEFWKYAMNGLSVYLDREKHPVDDRRLRLALRDLRQAVAELANGSSLDVRNLAFCSKVDSFGSYQEFPEYKFEAGQEVLLYVEVENFTSQKKADAYETSLLGSYRVFNAQKNRVADHTFIEETETCRNQRRDYFITYRMWIPKDIEPGQYTLQLTLEDLKGNKSGQASLRFEVAD